MRETYRVTQSVKGWSVCWWFREAGAWVPLAEFGTKNGAVAYKAQVESGAREVAV